MDYDGNPIIVHTTYTFKQMKGFYLYQVRYIRYIFFVVLPFAFLGILTSVSEGMSEDVGVFEAILVFLPTISLTFGLGLAGFGLFYTKKSYQRLVSNLPNGQTYTFRSLDYDVEMHSSNISGKFTNSYHLITRVRETKSMFYLYIDKRTSQLVDKQGFNAGTPEEFRQLLLKNIPPKKCKFQQQRT